MLLARKAADELHRRHYQDHGVTLRRLVLDVWGSATMRTGGEALAIGLVLMGVVPVWDAASNRVTGFVVQPIAELSHPRVDVTLRISGLFRDAFPAQITLFDAAMRAVAARDEAADWNPLAAEHRAGDVGPRIYGAAAGGYGAGTITATAMRSAANTWLRPPPLMAGTTPRMRPVLPPAWVRPMRSCIRRTIARPISWTAPITPRTKAGSPPPPRCWGGRPRCITPTPPAPTRQSCAVCRRKSPAWCAAAPPIRAGSRA